MAQCAAVDYTARVASVFAYSFDLDYLSLLTGLPANDLFLISLSEFMGFLRCLAVREKCYIDKLIAYAGDNR